MKYAKKLKDLRVKYELTQREIAPFFKVAHGTIALWELDKRKIPGPVEVLIDNFSLLNGKKMLVKDKD